MANALASLSGNRLDRSVTGAVALWRALWTVVRSERQLHFADSGSAIMLPMADIRTALDQTLKPSDWPTAGHQARLTDALLSSLPLHESDSSVGRLSKDFFCLFDLVTRLLSDFALECDLRYWAARNLRATVQLKLSSAAVAAIQSYTNSVRYWLAELGDHPRVHYGMFVIQAKTEDPAKPFLEAALKPAHYFDLIAAAGWVWPAEEAGLVETELASFNAEKLMGICFGLPTAIPGMDELFAGSGLLLMDAPAGPTESAAVDYSPPIGGRAIVITGPYGSGKSTLALELANEVARKGGAALIAAMEQTPEECLYSMASLGILRRSHFFQIVTEIRDAIPLFTQPYNGTGVLAFLPVRRAQVHEGKLEDFIKSLEDRFSWMSGYPLRLIVIDPMNSVVETENEPESLRRAQLLGLFAKAKRNGINLCLTRERLAEVEKDPPFEENIADTVLHASTRRYGSSSQRGIQVRKSRLQREEPSVHHFNIKQGVGVQIYPSSASVAASVTAQIRKIPPSNREFMGIDGIDDMLGQSGLTTGDIVAFDGPPGSSRTLIGCHFLFVRSEYSLSQPSAPLSLFVTDSDHGSVLSRLMSVQTKRHDRKGYRHKLLKDIWICPIAVGASDPSEVLQTIRDSFKTAERQRRTIDRVLIADVARWNKNHDRSEHDETFGYALVALLRSYSATCVLLADYIHDDHRSVLRDVIVNGADCQLKFEQMEFRGQVRHFIRGTKSRNMTHRRDLFEVVVNQSEVTVSSAGVLLRKDERGKVHPVKVRLFLHADSPHHHKFNQRLIGSIKTSLTDADIDHQWGHYDQQMFRLSASSAVDEVQIMQLDEFQLPPIDDAEIERKFFFLRESLTQRADRFGNLIPRLQRRIITKDGKAWIAAPFYQNIGVLARHNLRFAAACKLANFSPEDFETLTPSGQWLQIQKLARKWEAQTKGHIFFSCPLAYLELLETYNCLFLEILLTFVEPPMRSESCPCALEDWLSRPEAKTAAGILRDICHRSNQKELEFFESKATHDNHDRLRTFSADRDNTAKGPVMWRHWYNTLSEMMSNLKPTVDPAAIQVSSLPGNYTAAGEWYLAVPAYSAAPELAWEIIEMVTSPERELQRIYQGVGLPIRASYYEQGSPGGPGSLASPFFHIPRDVLREVVNRAFERSSLPCYQRMAETISAHLQRIVEIPSPVRGGPHTLTQQVHSAFNSLLESMRYIRQSTTCESCNQKVQAEGRNGADQEVHGSGI